jgi:type VI protein secretion system component Hcp
MSHKAGGAAYLKFDGIKGESMDDKHKSEIELLSAVQALPVVIKIV